MTTPKTRTTKTRTTTPRSILSSPSSILRTPPPSSSWMHAARSRPCEAFAPLRAPASTIHCSRAPSRTTTPSSLSLLARSRASSSAAPRPRRVPVEGARLSNFSLFRRRGTPWRVLTLQTCAFVHPRKPWVPSPRRHTRARERERERRERERASERGASVIASATDRPRRRARARACASVRFEE